MTPRAFRTIKPAAGQSSITPARARAAVRRVMADRARFVQLYNPRARRWVKIDRVAGRIIAHKRTPGPYVGVPIVERNPQPA